MFVCVCFLHVRVIVCLFVCMFVCTACAIRNGESMAHAMLSSEFLVLELAKIPHFEQQQYIGRAQYPKFVNKHVTPKCLADTRFSDKGLGDFASFYNQL